MNVGRPTEEFVIALEEFHPGMPENLARSLAEVVLNLRDDPEIDFWNSLAMVRYTLSSKLIQGLVKGLEAVKFENRARMMLMEQEERYDDSLV